MAVSDVMIIGAGLSGLCCARHLLSRDIPCRILEASDAVGGRVRTDDVEGFLLDRGFQVFPTAYPEARQMLDYDALDLQPFRTGALIYFDGKLHEVVDPRTSVLGGVRSLLSPIGSLADKGNVLRLIQAVTAESLNALWHRPPLTTDDALRSRYGFSDAIIERFFRPFLGGVMLDRDLQQSSRFFEFVVRMFATGPTAVPASGMEAIPRYLASMLPPHTIRLNARVVGVAPGEVRLETGETLQARAIVLATEGPEAAYLLPDHLEAPASRSSTTLYFAADKPPVGQPVLVLDGEGTGPANSVAELSTVAPRYAPPGKTLVSVSVVGNPVQSDAELTEAVRRQLSGWFGAQVGLWRHLHTYRVLHALPDQSPPTLDPPVRPVRLGERLFVAGDYRTNGSINGAMEAGRLAAEAVIADFA